MAKFDYTPLIIVGGIGVALYMFKDQIGNLFKGAEDTSAAIGNVATTTGDTLSDDLDLLNVKHDLAALWNFIKTNGNSGPFVPDNNTANYYIGVVDPNAPTADKSVRNNSDGSVDVYDYQKKTWVNVISGNGGGSSGGGSSGGKSLPSVLTNPKGDSLTYNNYNPINTTDITRSDYGTLPGN
jgi:hypothetical protein